MGLFGKSFGEKVNDAINVINKSDLGVTGLKGQIDGKVVTLEGQAASVEAKGRAMLEFNKMVKTGNTINKILVQEAPAPSTLPGPGAPAAGDLQIYEVKPGDTLGALAQRFYGKASLYPKIFEANRDILDNPDLIKVGQKLKIPKI
ncbi:MAG: LysM peptidoglycan-binding domain-containing protein [Candidatus Aminicenantes bacterium]|nr:LysM peptidoglycan-binding domain-containing protein [Candidatus Aminicenantes bacterium]